MLKNLEYTCRLHQEDDAVVAVCPEFNVSSFGDTPEEAVACLHEAVTLFLEECQRMDTLEVVLEGPAIVSWNSVAASRSCASGFHRDHWVRRGWSSPLP